MCQSHRKPIDPNQERDGRALPSKEDGKPVNVVFITIDSLNRHFLKAYGQPVELDVKTPNIDRLAARGVVFDRHYAGSLPCMPARREFFAGIQEFLWRPWGPMEPFDRPLARVARENGFVTQLITDHYHYFQHGSHGYFTDYDGFEFIRGQESDAWKTSPVHPDRNLMRQIKAAADGRHAAPKYRVAYARNAANFSAEEDFLAPRVFRSAADWLENNREHEQFLLVIDSFDVHEPFHNPANFAGLYTNEDPSDPELVIWPEYGNYREDGRAKLSDRQVAFVRAQYAAKISLMDKWVGRVLDQLDALRLWENTVVILTTDHGHYLGEGGWMGKPACPNYDILAHIPLIIWHPQGVLNGGRSAALTSAVDLYATMVEAMGVSVPPQTHGVSLMPLLLGQTGSVRDWALYGYFGRTLNITDGRYTYHLGADSAMPLNIYSTMFMNPTKKTSPVELPANPISGRFLPYTESKVWKYPVSVPTTFADRLLFDTDDDPWQQHNLTVTQPRLARQMHRLLESALRELQAPSEIFDRFAVGRPGG